MMLIVPSIEIKSGECSHAVKTEDRGESIYSLDPVKMAVLWRGENARSLHVVDRDAASKGYLCNLQSIKRLIQAVDIPVQVAGGLQSFEDIRALLEAGVYRVVIGSAAVSDPSLVERVVREYGSRTVAVAIQSWSGRIRIGRDWKETGLTPMEHVLHMKKLGVMRILYSSLEPGTGTKILDVEGLRDLARTTKLRFTAQGGISSYQDLIRLQELESVGVDSVIIGQAMYENRFSCQRLWRLNEVMLKDLGPTRRI